MIDNNRNSYGKILKATGLFGGVKVFEILITIIRSKFVAVLLGPGGMGIYGLISSPIGLIKQLTCFGLATSGVREVSKAYGEKDEYRKNYVVTILRKFVWLTGILGLLIAFFMARWLSQWSFGNTDYTLWFRLVSVTLLIDQLVVGQRVLMQGTFHYSYLAKSAVIGNVVGLLVTIPLYYWFGVNGIVPVFILHSLTSLALSWYFSHKITFEKVKLSRKELLIGGSTMMSLGFAIAMTGSLNHLIEFVLRLFLSNYGDVADVGLFNAGIAMANSYIGVIMSAMSTDYTPRLAAASGDNREFNAIINRQLQLLILIIGPIVSLFIVLIKEIVTLLYSTRFIPITGMIEWIMFGMFFRAVSFCMSYGVIAKADSKRFFWNEFVSNIYYLGFYILGYQLYGFEGMGIAYCLTYLVYSAQMYIFCRKRYSFRFESKSKQVVTIQMVCVVVLFALTKVFKYSVYRYVFGVLLLGITAYMAYRQLNTMIDIRNSIINIKNKYLKRNAK